MSQTTSHRGIQHLVRREGKRRSMYHDVAGLPTIGAGHLLTRSELTSGKIHLDGKAIRWRNGLTDQQINDLLAQDLAHHERAVNRLITVPLTQNQFDTLVSFSYNVGIGALKSSTLRKVLNRGGYIDVPQQLKRWKYAGGKVSKGLKNRRRDEIKQWSTPDSPSQPGGCS